MESVNGILKLLNTKVISSDIISVFQLKDVVQIVFCVLMVPVYQSVCCVIFGGTVKMAKTKSFVVTCHLLV